MSRNLRKLYTVNGATPDRSGNPARKGASARKLKAVPPVEKPSGYVYGLTDKKNPAKVSHRLEKAKEQKTRKRCCDPEHGDPCKCHTTKKLRKPKMNAFFTSGKEESKKS
ncbi:MAG: hypothetical protein HY751_05535 [Nitrospinae bacterium]|nr:hypothetical protein [Nitrospinota bacterium]